MQSRYHHTYILTQNGYKAVSRRQALLHASRTARRECDLGSTVAMHPAQAQTFILQAMDIFKHCPRRGWEAPPLTERIKKRVLDAKLRNHKLMVGIAAIKEYLDDRRLTPSQTTYRLLYDKKHSWIIEATSSRPTYCADTHYSRQGYMIARLPDRTLSVQEVTFPV